MPFGRHRGRLLRNVPTDYLEWARTVAREPLRSAIRAELARRQAHPPPPPLSPYRAPARVLLEQLVMPGRRTLALRHHPDAGGVHEVMVAINDAADFLLQQIRRLDR
jgi:hypothetical protein